MRIAFLAILAVQRGSPVSRDRLIGLLWPEHDGDRARRLLSEALYVVRKELSEEVIVAAGDDLRLDPDALASDVEDFRRALAGDRLEAAVEAYGGPFLDGFFIEAAPAFEKWVDEERADLAHAYADALRELARGAEEDGDARAAAAWWQRLAAHDPFDASVALGLMRALVAAGNRAAAIRHAQVHAGLLREELEAEPDPDVEALAARLREEPRPVGREETAATEAAPRTPADSVALVPSKPRSRTAEARSAWRRHRGLAALALLVLAALALWRWGGAGDSAPDAAAGPGTALVVAPFRVQAPPGSEDATFLSHGLATLLATALDGAGDLRAVDSRTVLAMADRRPDLDGERLAGRLGAAAHVYGTAVLSDARLRVEARLVDTSRSGGVAAATGQAPVDSLFSLVDALATQLLAARGADPLSGVAARTTSSLEAFKAFQDGAEAFRATRYEEATGALRRAVELDPTYALAHYRLSAAAQWAFDFQLARVAIRSAQRHAARLPDRERALVGAWAAFLEGEPERAERAYEALVAQLPGDAEAWAGLGEVLVHYNPIRGRSSEEALAPLRRAVALDPGVGEARFHLLEFAAAGGDRAAFDSLFAPVDSTSDQAAAWRAVRAFAWGDAEDRARASGELSRGDPIAYGVALGRVAANLGDLDAAARLGDIEDPPLDTPELLAAGRLLRASIEAARGRPDAARRLLEAAERAEPDWTRELAALFALMPEASADTAALRSLRAELLAWDPGARSPNIGFFLGAHADAHRHLRAYLLGLLAARLGDADDAQARAGELDRLGRSGDMAALGRGLAASVRAHLAAAGGDAASAARHLGDSDVPAATERVMISPFFARSPDRWLRASLARDAGDDEEALRWLVSLTDGYDFLYAAPAHRAIGEIMEAADRPAEAAAHYRRYLALRAEAEPSQRAGAEAVAARLAALSRTAPGGR